MDACDWPRGPPRAASSLARGVSARGPAFRLSSPPVKQSGGAQCGCDMAGVNWRPEPGAHWSAPRSVGGAPPQPFIPAAPLSLCHRYQRHRPDPLQLIPWPRMQMRASGHFPPEITKKPIGNEIIKPNQTPPPSPARRRMSPPEGE